MVVTTINESLNTILQTTIFNAKSLEELVPFKYSPGHEQEIFQCPHCPATYL